MNPNIVAPPPLEPTRTWLTFFQQGVVQIVIAVLVLILSVGFAATQTHLFGLLGDKTTPSRGTAQKNGDNAQDESEDGGQSDDSTTATTDKKDSGGTAATGGSSSKTKKSTDSSSGGGTSSGSSSGSSSGGSTTPPASSDGCANVASRSCYPERYSVGAPGVGHYAQSDASLPVPAGYTEVFPDDPVAKELQMYNCSGTTNLDHKYFHAYIYIGTGCHGTINITNSIVAPPPNSANRAILVNADNSASLTVNVSDTTIRPEPVPLGGTNNALTDHVLNDCETCTIHMNRVDVANSGGMCLCGRNTIVENSWLHDNYIAHLADPSLAHTGGIFPYGGSGPLTIRYNRLEPGVNAATGLEVTDYWKAITAPLFTQSSGGSVLRNYQAYNNFVSLGATNAYFQDGENMIFRNNVFGPYHFSNTATCSSGCTISFADWSGNVIGDIAGSVVGGVVGPP